MDRRAWLGLCTSVAASLAGCGGSEEAATSTDKGRATTKEDSNTATVTVAATDAPQTVELGTRYTVVFTLQNPTNRDQSLETNASIQINREWRQYTNINASVPPGQTTAPREFVAPPFLGSYRVRIEGTDAAWTIKTTERQLTFGETFTTPRGLDITVRGGRFTTAYTGGGNQTTTATEGQRFAVVAVRIRNPTGQAIAAPPLNTFRVHGPDNAYPVSLATPDQRLPIEPRNTKEVDLPFQVPEGLTASDLAVRWSATYQAGTSAARWHPSEQ